MKLLEKSQVNLQRNPTWNSWRKTTRTPERMPDKTPECENLKKNLNKSLVEHTAATTTLINDGNSPLVSLLQISIVAAQHTLPSRRSDAEIMTLAVRKLSPNLIRMSANWVS